MTLPKVECISQILSSIYFGPSKEPQVVVSLQSLQPAMFTDCRKFSRSSGGVQWDNIHTKSLYETSTLVYQSQMHINILNHTQHVAV